MDANIRHYIYKYNIFYDDWFNDLSNIYLKIETHIHVHSISNKRAMRVMCEARDCGLTQFGNSNQLSSMIDLLCTK